MLRLLPTYVLRDYKGEGQHAIDRELARRNRRRTRHPRKIKNAGVFDTSKLSTRTPVA